jgi:hypothetical protein
MKTTKRSDSTTTPGRPGRTETRSAPVGERGQVEPDAASTAITNARIDALERRVRSVESLILRKVV